MYEVQVSRRNSNVDSKLAWVAKVVEPAAQSGASHDRKMRSYEVQGGREGVK